MADGEFRFLLGHSKPAPPIGLSFRGVARWLKHKATPSETSHRSGALEYGFENYSASEREQLSPSYRAHLREIAADGVLAIAFHDTEGFRFYADAVMDALDDAGVVLSESNYIHMYSVYALLHGSSKKVVYQGRRILVVTSARGQKQARIEEALLAEGAQSVAFLSISPSKAMMERVHVAPFIGKVDVALVGAGVGAAGILTQLRPLGVTCIDVGFCLSTLVDPALRFRRPYCVPDHEFDLSRTEFEARAGFHRRAVEWLRRRGKK